MRREPAASDQTTRPVPPSCPGPDRTSTAGRGARDSGTPDGAHAREEGKQLCRRNNGGAAVNDKIQPHHLGLGGALRPSILALPSRHNRESRALQYAMQDRLRALGWSESRSSMTILVLRGRHSDARRLWRMVADVCLGKVGAVAAREVSRFARNSRDWQQLIEMCRVVDTLLVDQEAVYAPRQGNDRLLLGLKGQPERIRTRPVASALAGRTPEMARRGELLVAVPVGYIKADGHRLEKIPTVASRRRSHWSSRSSPNSAASVRRCCGFSSMAWICRPVERAAMSSGSGPITQRFTGS